MYSQELNYKMPAEWSSHQRTFISWPVRESMCYPEDYEDVCRGYAEIIDAVAEFEQVTVIVNPGDDKIANRYITTANMDYLPIKHNDAWLRDNGPTFVRTERGILAGINWHFNAWGGKYSPWDLDEEVAPHILKRMGVRCFNAPLVMEGGSIHVDGEGTMLTTEECLLNPNRNPELKREIIEETLSQYLGVKKIIWLNRGLSGDETDGHVDNIACFAAPGKIIIQICDDPADENYDITQENMRILQTSRDARGRELEIISISQPPRMNYNHSRLTLSYLNFYFVNGGLILPVFGENAQETDRQAMAALSAAFPNRRIRTVNGMTIVREGGNVHCITQQMPAGIIK
ncbi:MAG: agmatine deiminase family protein [Syntrophomonadaceae bacterium]|nr:agmatine deiminase family protein [Syntrophomonadaceae bacterium]